jgi:hypothetical protein
MQKNLKPGLFFIWCLFQSLLLLREEKKNVGIKFIFNDLNEKLKLKKKK